jgi:membrane-bound lytic murein transglycosylase B
MPWSTPPPPCRAAGPPLRRVVVAMLVIACAVLFAPGRPVVHGTSPDDQMPPFGDWLASVRAEAIARGISAELVDRAFDGLAAPEPTVIERDRTQAEFVLDLDAYLRRRLTPVMTRRGRALAAEHRALLARVGAAYDVQPRVVVAIWGIESNYGRFAGVRPTIAALATLAYEPRRADFFRRQLFDALEIVHRGDIELDRLKGSWAGAMGQPQFMPSSYLAYAVDFDGDGRRDIWSSPPDVFASMANYLQAHGWSRKTTWGREVVVSEAAARRVDASVPRRAEGCRAVREMTEPRPLAEWHALGVRRPGGAALPRAELDASLVRAGKRAFLVYRNYEALLAYNCAHPYALSVALLADRIGG